MKSYFTFILAFLFLGLQAQNQSPANWGVNQPLKNSKRSESLKLIIGETYSYKHDSSSVFTDTDSVFYKYSFRNLLGRETRFVKSATNWTNSYRSTYKYDKKGNKIEQLDQYWNSNNNWKEEYKELMTYNDKNLITTYERQASFNETFVTDHYEVYTYDSKNKLIVKIIQYYNSMGIFLSMSRVAYTYDSSGNERSQEFQVSSDWSSVWSNVYKIETTYDAQDNPKTIKKMNWDQMNKKYVVSSQQKIKYMTGNHPVQDTTYFLDPEAPSKAVSYKYDKKYNLLEQNFLTQDSLGNFNLTEKINFTYTRTNEPESYKWCAFSNLGWNTIDSAFYVYDDGDNTITTYRRSQFAGINKEFVTTEYYINSPSNSTIGVEENVPSNFEVFPNPSDGIYNISLPEINSDVSIEVYDMLGQSVYIKKTKKHLFDMDLSANPNGVYLLKITAGKTTYHRRLVKQ